MTMRKEGSVEVDREALGVVLAARGVSSAVAMKGRVKFVGVKRSRCHVCYGTFVDGSVKSLPDECWPCTCPNGWSGMETTIPIGDSSGDVAQPETRFVRVKKKGFFARAWAGLFNNS